MRKLIAIIVTAVLLLSVCASPVLAAKPGADFNGPHFNLNLIGKKTDWSGGGSYNNPDRHTIFVPEDTSTFSYALPDGTIQSGSIKLEFTQTTGEDFAVLDGNAFDDGVASFQLAKGRYQVYIVSRAKPGFSTDINALVYFTDNLTQTQWMSLLVGEITVTRKWQDATPLFYVSDAEENTLGITADTWVFDYLDMLAAAGYGDGEYFWDYDNNGNKLVQVRFYPVR
jgi:hypothetical protein